MSSSHANPMPGTFVDPDPDNSFVDLRSADPNTVIDPDDGEEYLQNLALRRADRLRRNQPTLHMGDQPVTEDTLPSLIEDQRVLQACLKTLAIGVFDRQEAEKLAQLAHTLLQERKEWHRERIALKDSQERRQLRNNNLATELRERKQECAEYRQMMMAFSQKETTDRPTAATPEPALRVPSRTPQPATPAPRAPQSRPGGRRPGEEPQGARKSCTPSPD